MLLEADGLTKHYGALKVVGGVSITVDAGTEITMTAKTKITLQVGSSKIEIEQSGIKITGTATVDMKSPMTTVKGDGMLTLKGGMTFIN